MSTDAEIRRRLAELRGWTPEAMATLGIGHDGDRVLIPQHGMSGELLGHLRYEPDPSRRNGSPKMLAPAGLRRQLFPPPERVTGELLLVLESEPDVILAHSLDLAAVAVPGAAGWRPEWAMRFQGRRVLLLPHADEPGRSAVQRWARDLVLFARDVRIADLAPDRNDGYDLTDYVRDNCGGFPLSEEARRSAREHLEKVADLAERIEANFDPDEAARANGEEPPPDAPQIARRLYRLAELANITSAAEDYVIGGGLLTRKAKLLLYAPAGKGKTTLADHLLACLASGKPFLGRFPIDRPYRVLMVQAELGEAELASHGQALLLAFGTTPATNNLLFLLDTQMRLPRMRENLRALIREERIEILALDPILEFFDGESSDKAEQVAKLLSTIDWLLEEEADLAGAIVVHHQNVAGNRTSGSWKFEAWPSTILRLEPVPGVETDRMLVFEKIRAPGFHLPEKMQIRLGDAGYLPIAGEAKLPEGKTDVVVQLIREAGGQLRREDLVERVGTRAHVKGRQAVSYIAQAKQEGAIAVFRLGHEAVYRLSEGAP
jgi:hypothetical protein